MGKKKGDENMFNKKLIKRLKETINSLDDELDIKEAVIESYQKENEILLENLEELRDKITDLENNIEFLTNNLSEKNKELVNNLNPEN